MDNILYYCTSLSTINYGILVLFLTPFPKPDIS